MKSKYPLSFWLLCLHMLIFMISFNLLIPELNDYITQLGAADKKWMNVGLWTIAAGLSRPISGKIADNFGRKITLLIGVFISIVVSFAYPLFSGVTAFLLLRFLHGFSTGFQPTGATALVADIIPLGYRGEAMGIFSLTISIGFGLGQYFSTFIYQPFQMNGLFIACGLFGIMAFILAFTVKEEHLERKEFHIKNIIPKPNEIIAPEVFHPTVIMFITSTFSGLFYLLVPDYSTHIGLTEKGLFWGVYSASTIGMRFIAGRAADKFGRRLNINVGLVVMFIAAAICLWTNSIAWFMVSAVIYGIGQGIISPSVFAWTADLANPKFKGRGMGTMFIALEFGLAAGNFFGQKIYNNQAELFNRVYVFGMILTLLGLIFMWFTRTKKTYSN